ncbi:MAG: glycerol-3-phosphate 1-O-acyltransferase PlsY [Hyphomicrobiales bacterium]|nr:glycerol-3-phosphate 1-O-acyltransferase PlsY [Hyphomicrobiales bacterium]
MSIILAALLGYLCGSVPFGLLLTKAAGLGDIRAIGSGNIGSTNVLRTGRKDLAAATLLLDALKGTVPVWLAQHMWGDAAALTAAAAAFAGHILPVWLKFRGGKGVATFLGTLLAIAPLAALVFAVVWLLVAYASRWSSAAALAASGLIPFVLLALREEPVPLVYAGLMVVLWFMHRANIMRLLAGSEPKIGAKP